MIDPAIIELACHEHARQQLKHGPQNYPSGTGSDSMWVLLDNIRKLVDHKTAEGTVTWFEVLTEEYLEVGAERDLIKLEAELIQVAAVALAWATRLRQGTVPGA